MEEDQVHLVSFFHVSSIILSKLSKALNECLDAVLENKKNNLIVFAQEYAM